MSFAGSVRALNRVEAGSQLSGQIWELPVDFKSPISTGHILARIDHRPSSAGPLVKCTGLYKEYRMGDNVIHALTFE